MMRVAILSLLAVAVLGSIGGDVSDPITSSKFQCAASSGWSFVIVRSYHSYGAPDTNAPATLAAAKQAGIAYRDVYHFPCLGVDPVQQLNDDVSAVGQSNFGTLWFDIETNPSAGCEWADPMTNCNFLESMINAGLQLGLSMGVYSSAYMWQSVMGNCSVGMEAGLSIWYANYDDTQSFSDYTKFGGWGRPAMKQYNDNSRVSSACGFSADSNWYPD